MIRPMHPAPSCPASQLTFVGEGEAAALSGQKGQIELVVGEGVEAFLPMAGKRCARSRCCWVFALSHDVMHCVWQWPEKPRGGAGGWGGSATGSWAQDRLPLPQYL